jgi:hypothetical protein
MKQNYLIAMLERWIADGISLRSIVFYRLSIALAILSLSFANGSIVAADVVAGVYGNSDLPACTDANTGTGVMYYFDDKGSLVSWDQRIIFLGQDSVYNASKLIEKNRTLAYKHTNKVDKNNTASAVIAILTDEYCPVYQCVFPAKTTVMLNEREIPATSIQEDCPVKTCNCGVIPCGKYWCCKC